MRGVGLTVGVLKTSLPWFRWRARWRDSTPERKLCCAPRNFWPHIDSFDRLFWSVLKDQFATWADALIIVKPETVVKWQKKRFQDFWTRKSEPGRPCIPRQHIAFIKRISGDPTSPRLRRASHPEYGEDHIALELEIKLGLP